VKPKVLEQRTHTDGRRFKVLAKTHFDRSIGTEKWSFSPRIGRPEKKLVAFYGTGRCGTTFSANALRSVGLDVRHQNIGRDGTSSHWFFVDSEWFPRALYTTNRAHVGERRRDFVFEHEVHVVRNPLSCVPSMCAVFGSIVFEFAADNNLLLPNEVSFDKMTKTALWWLRVNEHIEKSVRPALRINLESYRESWPTLMSYLGQDPALPYPVTVNKNKAWHRHKHTKFLNWSQLEDAVGKTLAKRVRTAARRYGYA
jgi:hypothetical protein